MKYLEIREKYLEYLKTKGHSIIDSSSLVPEDDPTVLFVNAGMFPLVPYLMGETHPKGTRLANSQRSLRTIDIDEVGDNVHLTTFEMLGNWSLNDYFKKEAIEITVGFMVDELGFEIENIYASVFEGDEDAPKDDASIEIWEEIFKARGIEAEYGDRIQGFGKKDNWWELTGGGPCGPDSEIFYDTGKENCGEDCNINCDCGKYVELGNNVFMQYLKEGDRYEELGRHNVDFGGGLDRLAMITQGVDNVWETDIYKPILEKTKELSKEENLKSQRIVIDHIKAATWIIADGVVPGRTEREYILRRLIRRAVRHGKILGIDNEFTREIGEIAIEQFKPVHPKLETDRERILEVLEEEEKKFNQTLEKGLKEFEKMFSDIKKEFKNENGETFQLYETYGFPLEMTLEELKSKGVKYDEKEVTENHKKAFEAHQEKSRQASKGMFKGGLSDTSDATKKLHTATHLLLAALYKVVGEHVYQKGSNITPERLRLDFPNDQKLTPEQVKEVEDLINEQIKKDLPIKHEEMRKEDALETVPYASFADKYEDIVKVYTIGDLESPFSKEICGGPHVEHTGELGKFRIKKQENVGAGIKRIKAVLE